MIFSMKKPQYISVNDVVTWLFRNKLSFFLSFFIISFFVFFIRCNKGYLQANFMTGCKINVLKFPKSCILSICVNLELSPLGALLAINVYSYISTNFRSWFWFHSANLKSNSNALESASCVYMRWRLNFRLKSGLSLLTRVIFKNNKSKLSRCKLSLPWLSQLTKNVLLVPFQKKCC